MSITTCVSLALKVLIILSTGLTILSWIGVERPTSALNLTDGFLDADRFNKKGPLPFYIMRGAKSPAPRRTRR